MHSWEGELDEFQSRAKKLEQDAKEAQEALDTAKRHATNAKNNPDLVLGQRCQCSVGGDVLGVLPCLGAVSLGIRETVVGLRASEEVVTLGKVITTLGTNTMTEAKAISALGNPALKIPVRGARNSAEVGEAIEITSGSIGLVTAGVGLAASAYDPLDSDVVKNSGSGVDGVRTIIDGGALIDLARYAF
ncbi:hypothetical protein ACIQOU_20985 [Streptomyces sp. NPDC091279]|uniref:hypothetical protein n=1 Tax=Streptomyces sp. NPDC091279 TaxID=3365983 RepID=UPI00381A2BFA